MDVVVFVVVLLGLAAYIAAPLYRGPTAAVPGSGDAREAVVRALRELERDRREGLVDDGEYRDRRRALEAEAVELWTRGD